MNKNELVGVVPQEIISACGGPGNLVASPKEKHKLLNTLMAQITWFPRGIAEYDETWKQLIPYILVTAGNESPYIFLTERLPRGNESRLISKMSIGVGGHINPEDIDPVLGYQGLVINCIKRELQEELIINPFSIQGLEFLGFLHATRAPVDRVHLGLVYKLVLDPEAPVRVAEPEVLQGSYAVLSSVAERYEQLETWSQIAFTTFFQDVKIPSKGAVA